MRLEIPQIDPSLWLRLNIEARHRGLDVSDLLVEALQQFLGLSSVKQSVSTPSNLERLAGTWSQEEAEEFDRNTEAFGRVDPDMWK